LCYRRDTKLLRRRCIAARRIHPYNQSRLPMFCRWWSCARIGMISNLPVQVRRCIPCVNVSIQFMLYFLVRSGNLGECKSPQSILLALYLQFILLCVAFEPIQIQLFVQILIGR
jgi:hypothetical protein